MLFDAFQLFCFRTLFSASIKEIYDNIFLGNLSIFSMLLRYSFYFLLCTILALPVHAADTGQILQQEQQLRQIQQLPQGIPDSLLFEQESKPKEDNGPKIFIRTITFSGNETFTDEELLEVVASYLGRPLNFTEIQKIADTLTAFYQEQGYFLAKALIPKQDVDNDKIRILIQEGALDDSDPLTINDSGAIGTPLRLKSELIKDYILSHKSITIKQDDLERGILNLNDNPGISSAANIAAGSKPGTSKIILDVAEGPLVDGSVALDNYGSRYTGQDRITASANLNNPTGYGDKLNFMTVNAIEEPFHLHRLAYDFPIGRQGLRANIAFSELDYTLGQTLKTTPSSGGAAYNWSANLKYPLHRCSKPGRLKLNLQVLKGFRCFG